MVIGAFQCYIATLSIDSRNVHALHGCAVVLKLQARLQDAVRLPFMPASATCLEWANLSHFDAACTDYLPR